MIFSTYRKQFSSLLFSIIFLSLTACGGGGGSSGGNSSSPTWEIGTYKYKAGAASGSSASGSSCLDCSGGVNNFSVLSIGTSGFDKSNGNYSGAGISIGHTLQGPGTYMIGDTLFMAEDKLSHKRMTLSVVAGTLVVGGGSTGYKAVTGSAEATVDSEGLYHFTIASPIQLEFTVNVLDGIPNAPSSVNFTMKNVHDHNP